MNQNKNKHSDAQLDINKNHKRRKKATLITHRTALHVLVGLGCIGLFWGVSTQINQPKVNSLNVQTTAQPPALAAVEPSGFLLAKPPLVDLQQLDDELYFENASAVFETKNLEIKVNRANKRDNTYVAARNADNIGGLRVSKDNLQIAALNPKINLQQSKIDELTKQLRNAQPFNVQPPTDELVRAKSNETKILSADEIEKLKQDVENEKQVFAPEKNAPMPTIRTGDEQETIEAIKRSEEIDGKEQKEHQDQKTAQIADDNQTVADKNVDLIKKPNAIVVVDGKIATKQVASEKKYITLSNVKVPAPLKRPIYIPKVKKPVTKKKSTERSSLTCLTTALYHEVRGESRDGQLAVAEVISSRKASKSYPNSICEVVYQNATKRNKCQFSFACDGKTDLPRDLKTWNKLKALAKDFLAGRVSQPAVRGATHYHATYVSPKWRWTMNRIGRIGSHIFYKDPRAKT